MKSLDNPHDKAEVLRRLQRVRTESRREWGRMSQHQMVCHLNDSFRVAMGEKTASSIGNVFHHTLVKWIALRTPLTWPKGVKTVPEVDQEIGGTRPVEFEKDLKELGDLVEQFTEKKGKLQQQRHPIFGKMTDAEWLRWGYLHTDHHLRQFGE